jgi:hypothetical protein
MLICQYACVLPEMAAVEIYKGMMKRTVKALFIAGLQRMTSTASGHAMLILCRDSG